MEGGGGLVHPSSLPATARVNNRKKLSFSGRKNAVEKNDGTLYSYFADRIEYYPLTEKLCKPHTIFQPCERKPAASMPSRAQ